MIDEFPHPYSCAWSDLEANQLFDWRRSQVRRKLEKVLEAANGSAAIFTRRRGGEKIVWVLGEYGEIVPRTNKTSNPLHQGWMETDTGERILVHYVKGFGWIPEEKLQIDT